VQAVLALAPPLLVLCTACEELGFAAGKSFHKNSKTIGNFTLFESFLPLPSRNLARGLGGHEGHGGSACPAALTG